MGFLRFFRRVKIFPCVTLNFSRSGISVSIGPRGCKWTIGPLGERITVGIPGTGLSYTEKRITDHEGGKDRENHA